MISKPLQQECAAWSVREVTLRWHDLKGDCDTPRVAASHTGDLSRQNLPQPAKRRRQSALFWTKRVRDTMDAAFTVTSFLRGIPTIAATGLLGSSLADHMGRARHVGGLLLNIWRSKVRKTKDLTLAGAAILLAVAFAPAAHAQEFDGPFVGAQVGWNQNDIADIEGATPGGGDRSDSFVGGVFAGYDYQTDANIVVGVEAGFSLGADDTSSYSAGASQVSLDPDYSFDVSARLGYVVGEKTLIYGRGGYANTRADVRIVDAGNIVRDDSENFDGWFVGGGAERRLSDQINARLEYRYSDLGSNSQDFERHQVLVGVSYRF